MPFRLRSISLLVVISWGLCFSVPDVCAQKSVRNVRSVSGSELPFNQQPIQYSVHTPDDAISKLQKKLRDGTVVIKPRGVGRTLRDLLKALDVPESSQLLVFSKSSANARFITPKTPRAVYFNDHVYVGWVPHSPVIEISAIDPAVGPLFYTLPMDETAMDSDVPIAAEQFRRDGSCLLCHSSASSLRVPGHLVRSFTTDSEGHMLTGWSRVTHSTPFTDRWGGWYVTGPSKDLRHLGNVFGGASQAQTSTPELHSIPQSLSYQDYLAPTSDIVSHLVLNHQAHGHNLINRLNYEARLNRETSAFEPLLRYLLFLDEQQLPAAIEVKSDYLDWFEAQGPQDSRGRTLRRFNLKTRLFEHRLSYLIYSPAIDSLPLHIRKLLYQELNTWLTTTDVEHPGALIPIGERQAIREILLDTKPDIFRDCTSAK